MINVIRITLAVAIFPMTIYQKLNEIHELKAAKPTGNTVNIGKHSLHAVVRREGKPIVVFDSGLGSFSLEWDGILHELSSHATTVAYDRAGYGWSHRNKGQATSNEIVENLRILLKRLGLEPPYILVGHSFGGLNMRLYALLYPEEVTGLVLIDPTNEFRFLPQYINEERRRQHKQTLSQYKLGHLFSLLGAARLINRPVWSRAMPRNYIGLGYRAQSFEALYKEYLNITKSCQAVNDKRIEKDLPIVLLTAGQMGENWKEDQNKMKKLFAKSKHIVVEDSSHHIHHERPEIVIHAIKEMIRSTQEEDGGI